MQVGMIQYEANNTGIIYILFFLILYILYNINLSFLFSLLSSSMFSFSTKTSGGVGTMQSLFTNNAQVFYKPHSLAVGGTGTVVNARHKSRRT
jgi:hypothetical protein